MRIFGRATAGYGIEGRVLKKFFYEHIWLIVSAISFVLLVVHAIVGAKMTIDTVSVMLVGIILISPFTSEIRKIKIAGFEAEISSKEIEELKDNADIVLPAAGVVETPEIQLVVDHIKNLVRSDYVLALAKLRIELEKVLSKLLRLSLHGDVSGSTMPVIRVLHELVNREVLSKDFYLPLQQVIHICNRAIHGEDIRRQDAESIVEIGTNLLIELSGAFIGLSEKPIEVTPIDAAMVEKYRDTRFRVTTIVPLSDTPVRNVRFMNHDDLDEFLDGYAEYAEFIIEIVEA